MILRRIEKLYSKAARHTMRNNSIMANFSQVCNNDIWCVYLVYGNITCIIAYYLSHMLILLYI